MRLSNLTHEIEACVMNKIAIIASLAAGLAVLPVANAGLVTHSPITIYHYSYATYASGSFHQALLSSDSQEYIGCAADSADAANLTEISCFARDATGQHFASCYSLSPSDAARQAVGAVGEYSYIYFNADTQGNCAEVYVRNSTANK
jgi:hypothetical protein